MKHVFLTAILLTANSAFGATKCLPLANIFISCTATTIPEPTATNWESVCTDDINTMAARGIGICASDNAPMGTVADTIHISPIASENVRCWCKITSPAVSKWVAHDECKENGCAYQCELQGNGYQNFRASLFNNWEI